MSVCVCVLEWVSPLRMVKGALLRPSNLLLRTWSECSSSRFPHLFLLLCLFSFSSLLRYPIFALLSLSSIYIPRSPPFCLSSALFLNFTLGVSAFTLFSMWINKNSAPHLNSFRVSHTHIHTRLCHVYKSLESKVTRGHTSLPGHCAPFWLGAAPAGNSASPLA